MNQLSLKAQAREHTDRSTFPQRMAQKAVHSLLPQIRRGHLRLEDSSGIYHFGEPEHEAEIRAVIQVHSPEAYRDVFLNATLGSGEAYMEGSWSSPDLVSVIRLMVNNMDMLQTMDRQASAVKKLAARLFQWLTANTLSGSRKNISAHYDLGNDFFRLFLDDTMMYSAAVFPDPQASLYQASVHKLDLICRKLELTENDRVIEIGTGWGGFALHAARHYGCHVTTTTISEEQFRKAQERVREAGLEHRITVLKQDYRSLQGQFDKLVSVEMIEAVGHQFYDTFFRKCGELLKPEGLMLIQAITVPDQRYQLARKNTDFIKRYIFPGGCLPSDAVFTRYLSRCTDMQLTAMEDITLHYADTLKLWRQRFLEQLSEVRRQGFDERFIRMWDFYLAYCEGGFRERVIGTVQYVCARPGYRPRG